jgi:conjugal transfer/type IV secretion protein DotA/TraY
MKGARHRLTAFVVSAVLFMAAQAMTTCAWAQPQPPLSIDQITQASPPTDESVTLLNSIIGGNFFVAPLSAVGGASTLLGGVLLIFNGAIFLVAVAWGTYNVLRAVVATAQDGEVLGKQMSTIWLPIRMVTGIVGIVPVFGGFNLAQVVLVVATAVGIGIANMMFMGAIAMTNGLSTLLSPMLVSPHMPGDHRKVAYGLFATEICYLAKRTEEALALQAGAVLTVADRITSQALSATPASAYDLQPVAGTVIKFGTPNQPDLCGHVALMARSAKNAGATRVLGVAVGYESAAINYERVEAVARAGYATAHQQLVTTVRAQAQLWWAERLRSQQIAQGTTPRVPITELDAAARTYASAAQDAAISASTNTDSGAIQDHVRKKMESGGWITLGSWHSAFTQANTAVVDAVSAITPEVQPPNLQAASSSSYMTEALRALARSASTAESLNTAGADKAPAGGWLNHIVCDRMPAATNVLGECSLGQAAVMAAVGAARGSGGYGLIDPIVMFKNLGDWMMNAGAAIVGAAVGTRLLGWAGEKFADVFGSTLGNLPGVGTLAKAAEAGASTVSTLGSYLLTAAAAALFIGAIMAVYIPLVPFITWMGGLIQYFVIFFEGMAAMTLAALAHMDTDGEGMGHRAEPGYIFLLNMVARPGLMVLGFIAASAASIALGTVQAAMFLPAIANAQGNSMTGLFSFLFLLVIFLIMNWALLQGLYNMIFLLPDNVIGIIGRSGGADIGKEVENKSYNLLLGMSHGFKGGVAQVVTGGLGPSPKGARSTSSAIATPGNAFASKGTHADPAASRPEPG